MRRVAFWSLRWCAVLFGCALVASTVRADAITSYTITDLGPSTIGPEGVPILSTNGNGPSAPYSAPTGADATVTSFDGKDVYAFPRTDNLVANPSSLIAQLPTPYNPYASTPSNGQGGDDLHYYYNNYGSGPTFLNANGVVATTEVTGVNGHIALAGSSVATFQKQPDGSFAPTQFPSGVSSPNNASTGGFIAQALDLNNRGQLLSVTTNSSLDPPIFLLTDLRTGIVTNLQDLMPSGWHLDYGQIEIDDQGRIVLFADQPSVWETSHEFNEQAFLLTPAGLSSDPIATPEPSTLATLAAVGVGLAIRRWKSR